jgi:hypothetical protein
LTDQAPEVLLGAYVGEANTESFLLNTGTVNPGDLVKLLATATGQPLQVVAAGAGDPVIGVVQRVYTVMGQTWVSVIVRGKTKLTASAAAIAAGAKVKAAGQSTIAAYVVGTDPVNAAFGTALQNAASGDTILVIVDCAGV